jgi:uncharacterized protein
MVTFSVQNTLYPFLGGLLLSVATSTNLLLKGRITGISGIFSNVIIGEASGFKWRSNFLAGLIFFAVIVFDLVGFNNKNSMFMIDSPAEYTAGLETANWVIAGLLVGFGTKLGSGCTSGHGLCGLPRLSIRSIVAVGTFMASGIVIATLRGSKSGNLSEIQVIQDNGQVNLIANGLMGASGLYFLYSLVRGMGNKEEMTDVVIGFGVGGLFSVALMMSGMTRRSAVLGFLNFDKNWNPAMMFVFMGALLGNFVAFPKILRRSAPVYGSFCVPVSKKIDWQLIGGAVIFGLGWGLGGLCPAPAIIGAIFYVPHVFVLFITMMALGQIACGKFLETIDKKTK